MSCKGRYRAINSAEGFIGALRRTAPVWERNAVRDTFADGDRACVVYDFVSNTEGCSVPFIELLTFHDDRIQSVELFFDRASSAPISGVLTKRTPK